MTSQSNLDPALVKPRWDRTRVTFEIEVAGEAVSCAISREALQDISGHRHFSSTDLLKCFISARPRIEAIAATKFSARADGVGGTVSIWADDVEDAPLAQIEDDV